jgi:hypothetical protein
MEYVLEKLIKQKKWTFKIYKCFIQIGMEKPKYSRIKLNLQKSSKKRNGRKNLGVDSKRKEKSC